MDSTYYVEWYEWDGSEYKHRSSDDRSRMDAKNLFNELNLSDDIPQVSIYEASEDETRRVGMKYLFNGEVVKE